MYTGGLYTGVEYIASPLDTAEGVKLLDDYLKNLTTYNQIDSVVSIFMIPSAFVETKNNTQPKSISVVIPRPTDIDGYKPKNNKLFTSPYLFISVDTGTDAHNYKFEYSNTKDKLLFTMACAMSANPEIVTYPRAYNGTKGVVPDVGGSATDSEINATETVTCTGFPQCAYTIDSYRAWLAQKSGASEISYMGSLIGTLGSAATGNLIGGALGVLGIAQQLNQTAIEATKGSQTRGNIGSSTNVGIRAKGVYFKTMSVTNQYAKMIDDFFTVYGYTCGRVKIPNRHSRPHWNFTKTKRCSITGSIPADDMKKICSIYDNGITFWKNPNEVGNYSLDNSPTV